MSADQLSTSTKEDTHRFQEGIERHTKTHFVCQAKTLGPLIFKKNMKIKSFFSPLRASILKTASRVERESALLGGVLRNNGAIFKENMFYLGAVRKSLSSLTLYTWHEHVDTGKKLKKIHGPNSDRTVEKLRIRHSIIVVDTTI